MKTAAKVFYLAVFALLDITHAADLKSPSKSKAKSPDVCAVRYVPSLPGIYI
jgi:ERO1-like protein beta